MALIENLEREGWEEFLQNCFRQTLDLLQNDRYGFAGSSVDDLKGWLTAGGIARVQYHLSDQAKSRGFSVDHRLALLNLMARGTIPGSTREVLASCKFSEMELNNLLDRLERGERPFEVLMSAQGYGIIDQWLLSSQN